MSITASKADQICKMKVCMNEDDVAEKVEEEEETNHDFYEWIMVPMIDSIEKKTGITFKGDTDECIEAHKHIWDALNKKGTKYGINGVEIRILDNATNKPIKVEVKPEKGPSGRVNVKIYNVNKRGYATMMISIKQFHSPSSWILMHL